MKIVFMAFLTFMVTLNVDFIFADSNNTVPSRDNCITFTATGTVGISLNDEVVSPPATRQVNYIDNDGAINSYTIGDDTLGEEITINDGEYRGRR